MLSDNIKSLRKNKGYTQEELAARINVVRQTVSKWEKGLSVPDAEALQRLADVLEVDIKELLGAPALSEQKNDEVVEQLARINEQLVIKNRRAQRIWKTMGIIFAVIVGFYVVLIILAIILVACRKHTRQLWSNWMEVVLTVLTIVAAVAFMTWTRLHLPLKDFRPYKVGNHLPTLMEYPEDAEPDVYEYSFV